MVLAQWFRPPRRTRTVFLCLMTVLGGALGWLSWQFLERDRLVERSRAQLGLPAALAASEARCSLLHAMGRTDELGQEATRMAEALWGERYVLLRPVWEVHLEEARRTAARR